MLSSFSLRKWFFILPILGFWLLNLPHARAEHSLKSVCERTHGYVLSLLNSDQTDMQMGVDNPSGYLKIGLCWWQSRFHRAALYVASFNQNLPKPTSVQVIKILRQISRFRPVVIPGFSGLNSFTKAYPQELEQVLSEWQLRTTLLVPQNAVANWMMDQVISGNKKRELVEQEAVQLIRSFKAKPRPLFSFMQGSNFQHAALVVGFEKDQENPNDVLIKYIDSNQSGNWQKSKFIENQKFNNNFMPSASFITLMHEGFEGDFDKIESNLKPICGSNYKIKVK